MSSPRWAPFSYVGYEKDNVRRIALGQGRRTVLELAEPAAVAGAEGKEEPAELAVREYVHRVE